MALEGFKLALLGMGMVFLFLILLVYSIKLSSMLLAPLTLRELKQKKKDEKEEAKRREQEMLRKRQQAAQGGAAPTTSYGKLVAVISAAISRFKNDSK